MRKPIIYQQLQDIFVFQNQREIPDSNTSIVLNILGLVIFGKLVATVTGATLWASEAAVWFVMEKPLTARILFFVESFHLF